MTFAQNLERLMTEKHITKYRLAKELGVHQTTIKNWVEGKTEPKFDMIDKIAKVLNISPNDLLLCGTIHLPSTTAEELAEPKEEYILRFDESPENIISAMKQFFIEKCHVPSSEVADLTIENIEEVSKRISNMTEKALNEENILLFYRSLNLTGKLEAIKRVEELTEIPKYTKPDEE